MKNKGIGFIIVVMFLVSVGYFTKVAPIKTMSERGKSSETQNEKYEKRDELIVVDAGHGGSDPGKVGVNDALEKDINLAIAKLVREALESRGFTVIMTREDDVTLAEENGSESGKAVDMRKRVELVNKSKADIFVSVHQNSYSDGSVKGPQVFYYASSEEGEVFAEVMQLQLNEGLQIKRPRSKKANDGYYMLKKSEVPAIIVECGFLSNYEEAEKLCDTAYQKLLADQIVIGICTYLEK